MMIDGKASMGTLNTKLKKRKIFQKEKKLKKTDLKKRTAATNGTHMHLCLVNPAISPNNSHYDFQLYMLNSPKISL